MHKPADTDYPVHELIANRWSPRAFSDQEVDVESLRSLLEAARWAASCFNEQPWQYLVAMKSDRQQFEKIADCLVDVNRQWAQHASVLLISLARTTYTRNGRTNDYAHHDSGMANASLSLEATARGLYVHFMAGFNKDKARELFEIPEDVAPVAAAAIGYPGDPGQLSETLEEREKAARSRNPQSEWVFSGKWGQSF